MTRNVSGDDVRHFRRHGWVRVPALHSAARLAVLRATMGNGCANPPDLAQTYGVAGTATPKDRVANADLCVVLVNVRELNLYYDEVKPMCLDHQVDAVVRALFGATQVRLFSETYLDKPRGGLPTPWHQDWPLQPFDRRDTVNCWVALDDSALDPGARYKGCPGRIDWVRCTRRAISASNPRSTRCCARTTTNCCGHSRHSAALSSMARQSIARRSRLALRSFSMAHVCMARRAMQPNAIDAATPARSSRPTYAIPACLLPQDRRRRPDPRSAVRSAPLSTVSMTATVAWHRPKIGPRRRCGGKLTLTNQSSMTPPL